MGRLKTPSKIDVAVVGGGPAGVAAATAASVSGAGNVLLVESSSRLGGSVTAAMHRCLCGLYSCEPQSPLDTLNAGTQRDVIAGMMQIDSDQVRRKQLGRTWVLEFPAAAYQAALLQACSKPNIHRMMNSRLTAVRRENSRITAIQIDSYWIEIKTAIDCTGSGALMVLAGEDVMLPADPQRMLGGYSIRLTGLTGDPEMLRLQTPYVLAMAVAARALPHEARFTLFHPGPGPGEGICKLAVNPDQFSAAAVPLLFNEIVDHLKNEVPGFAAAEIAETSPHALPRDGRRLKGKNIVTEENVLEGRQLDQNAVHAWWPIERWDLTAGPVYTYPPQGRHYDISNDALQSAVVENLFAAGTCVSATAAAAASLRASGICLATGHAAGQLASGIP